MRLPSAPRRLGLQFNITPLIDIVFLLIIFFLVASHFVRSENLEAVELPDATAAQEDKDAVPNRLTITIRADTTMKVAGRVISITELPTLLAGMQTDQQKHEPEIRIRADKSVQWKFIEPVMLECAKLGVLNVKYAVVGNQQ
jgi:biopolymer transport protein ExbD